MRTKTIPELCFINITKSCDQAQYLAYNGKINFDQNCDHAPLI